MPDDLRATVLCAMGYEQCDCSLDCDGYMAPSKVFSDRIFLSAWHPDRSLDDVALVERWIIAEGYCWEYFNALADVLKKAGKFKDAMPWQNEMALICAAPAERWQACLAVMREAGVIGGETA